MSVLTSSRTMPFACLGDNEWQRAALHRLADMGVLNRKYHSEVAAAVRLAPGVIDYFEQAPVLMAAGCGENCQAVERAMADGAGLRQVMRLAGLPYPLRHLIASVVLRHTREKYQALANVPPSILAQSIPDNSYAQSLFVNNAFVILDCDPAHLDRQTFRNWAMQRVAPADVSEMQTIVDYVTRGRGAIDFRWTLQQALAAAQRWHATLRLMTNAHKFKQQHGVEFDQDVDYAGFATETLIGDYTFRALRSGHALHNDGKVMHHCVASYASDVIRGTSRIFSITQGGKPVATLELRRGQAAKDGWGIRQLCGPCNARPAEAVRAAAHLFTALSQPKPDKAAS